MDKYLDGLRASVPAVMFAALIFMLAMFFAIIGFWGFRLFLGLFGIQIVPSDGPAIGAAVVVMALILWVLVVLPSLGLLFLARDEFEKEAISLRSREMFLENDVKKLKEELRKKLESETTDSTT